METVSYRLERFMNEDSFKKEIVSYRDIGMVSIRRQFHLEIEKIYEWTVFQKGDRFIEMD